MVEVGLSVFVTDRRIAMSLIIPPSKENRHERLGTSAVVTSRLQLSRLFRLVLILQSERFPNARELAERCEMSRRTVYRDLEILESAGIPVRYRPERQGYQLGKGFFLQPVNIEEAEALALLVLARQWSAGEGLGLLRHALGGALKLVQGLPDEIRDRVVAKAEAFRRDAVSEDGPENASGYHRVMLDALSQQRQLRVWYLEPISYLEVCTKFSLYRILLHDHRWFMVGRSSLKRRVDVIGMPTIVRLQITDDPYVIPPRFNLEKFLANAWGVDRGAVRYSIRLRFERALAGEVTSTKWHRSQTTVELPDGRVDAYFMVDGLNEILRWVLGFGDMVEVLAPKELRTLIRVTAMNIARMHEASRILIEGE